MKNETVSVPADSLAVLLSLLPLSAMPAESAFHWHCVNGGQTLEKEGYTPTSFDSDSFKAQDAVDAWISQKTAEGYAVSFNIGKVACSERLSVYWSASKECRFGTSSGGCIDLCGNVFMFM